jgi:hypothetical protein
MSEQEAEKIAFSRLQSDAFLLARSEADIVIAAARKQQVAAIATLLAVPFHAARRLLETVIGRRGGQVEVARSAGYVAHPQQ